MKRHITLLLIAPLLVLASCAKHPEAAAGSAPAAHHAHTAPHGGTLIEIGEHAYNLEFVRDAAAGKLTAYVLDGHAENFVRIKAAGFELVAGGGATKRVLAFRAAANPATGETAGDTSQFEAQADWLKSDATFDATLTSLEIKGTAFSAIAFHFPKGNDKD